MNWKKIVETTLSVGVAVAASIIGDKFVAKAAKTITSKDDDNVAEPIDVKVNEEDEENEEETDEEKEVED
jgi:3-phosphoglycerate kinase